MKDIKSKIIKLLETKNKRVLDYANFVRHKNVGNSVHLRALIEFSNYCKNNCKYCGLRSANKNIKRYRMSLKEIIKQAELASRLGYKTVVLQSGEDSFYTNDKLCYVIEKIKKLDLAITLSIGERSFSDYKDFKMAGADRYLLKIETTDKNLYKSLHPNMNYENRVNCLKNLKSLNFEVGTGNLVGLPNQSIESIANDILFFKNIDADMIGIGAFIPHPDTPLAFEKNGDFFLALKIMAITRILMKDINIPATTAMETLSKNGKILALKSGANVVMLNLTEKKYKKLYEIYPGKNSSKEDPKKSRISFAQKLKSINRFISNNKGSHKHKKIFYSE